MEKSQFDDAFVPFFRRDEIAEAACRIGEHGCHQRGGNMDIRPVFFSDVEMVRMLFGKSLKPFHKVRKRAKKRFFLNCHFADRFRNKSCGNDIDEVAVIDFPYIDSGAFCLLQHPYSALGRTGDMKRPCQIIHRSKRNKTEA